MAKFKGMNNKEPCAYCGVLRRLSLFIVAPMLALLALNREPLGIGKEIVSLITLENAAYLTILVTLSLILFKAMRTKF